MIFDNIENAMRFSDHVISTMPPVKNRPEIFGEQLIMDEEDNVIGKQEKLLPLARYVASDLFKVMEGAAYLLTLEKDAALEKQMDEFALYYLSRDHIKVLFAIE